MCVHVRACVLACEGCVTAQVKNTYKALKDLARLQTHIINPAK